MEDIVGKTLGQYRVVERLGKGGMAEVFRAFHPALNRYVAIKVMHPFVATEEGFLDRFRHEAQSVAALRHPNIVQVFDFGTEGSLYYMVMEFVEGPTLKKRIAEARQEGDLLPLEEVGRIIDQVAQALDYAHRRGMIHRDVKPANILLSSEGEAVLADFGVARMLEGPRYTLTGIMGTPDYMSPEQGLGQEVDARSDVYALGVVLYEMLVGEVPFKADTPLAVVLKHIQDPLPLPTRLRPELPEALERVVLKAMAKEPEGRYESAGEMAEALERALEKATRPEAAAVSHPEAETAPLTGPTIPVETARRPALWLRWAAGAGLVLTLVIAATLLGTHFLGTGPPSEPARTTQPPRTGVVDPTVAAIALPATTPSPTATPTESPTFTPFPTATPTETPRATPSPTATPSKAPTSTPSPTATPTEEATATPSPTSTAQPATAGPERIVFVSYRDDDAEIYAMNVDGSDVQRLTDHPGEDWHPCWSPDGQRIVFQSVQEPGSPFNIAMMNRDGSDRHLVTNWDKTITGGGVGAQRPVWSPDGQRIAFSFEGADLNATIYVVNDDGSDLKQLTYGRDPSWASDGQRIAFESHVEGALEIFTIRPDSSELTPITSTGDTNMYATWSPDGQQIAYVRQAYNVSGIYALDLTTGRTRKLVEKPSWGLSWSPDGTRLAYAPSNEGIWIVTTEWPFRSEQISPDGSMPSWSP